MTRAPDLAVLPGTGGITVSAGALRMAIEAASRFRPVGAGEVPVAIGQRWCHHPVDGCLKVVYCRLCDALVEIHEHTHPAADVIAWDSARGITPLHRVHADLLVQAAASRRLQEAIPAGGSRASFNYLDGRARAFEEAASVIEALLVKTPLVLPWVEGEVPLSLREASPGQTPLADLDLNVRTHNALLRDGYTTVEQLTGATWARLLDIRDFGVTSLRAVGARLAERGLAFAGERPEDWA